MKSILSVILILLFLVACSKSHEPAGAAKYHCPMHPTVVSDKPGDCPICGMRLVPINQGDSHESHADASSISITPAARQRMGLTLGTVEKRALSRDVRTSARIVADETKLYRVTVKIDGWVEKLFVAATGQRVNVGDPLLTIYSPDLLAAQREYLTADASLKASARRRLKLWDISDEQIAKLEESGEAQKVLTLSAPASGYVQDKMVLAGQKIMPGEALMTIADLSTIWAEADIYQPDLPFVKEGMIAEISGTITGKVTFVSPVLAPETLTAKARLEIPNPDLQLKPGMFATARLHFDLGERLAIPDSAVMRTGERTYAFKDTGDGHLTPVEIKTGVRSDGWFELLAGLNEGDKVVTSANFLVDSESSLKAALAGVGNGHASH